MIPAKAMKALQALKEKEALEVTPSKQPTPNHVNNTAVVVEEDANPFLDDDEEDVVENGVEESNPFADDDDDVNGKLCKGISPPPPPRGDLEIYTL